MKKTENLKISILGIQGSGKSTQAEIVSSLLGLPMISLGGLLRRGIDANDTFVTNYYPRSELDAGHLAPDILVKALLKRELENLSGFVLEGFPRTIEQAEFLQFANLDHVIEIILDEQMVAQRLSLRGRSDDTDWGITRRIEYYNDHIVSIRKFFEDNNSLRLVDGNGSIACVTERIIASIETQ